ncbi:hypothetical protein CPB85DRAFT_807288 [Mucidula mucida]|nr:hypothetical protein CPB85DRAFT_807288 [Mucidula mucida]
MKNPEDDARSPVPVEAPSSTNRPRRTQNLLRSTTAHSASKAHLSRKHVTTCRLQLWLDFSPDPENEDLLNPLRKNISDYFEPYLFQTLRNRLMQVPQQLSSSRRT